jgi:hypothetical protein
VKRPEITVDLIEKATENFCATHNFNKETIVNAYSHIHPADGFELSKSLMDDYGWDISREEMEELDEIEGLVDDELKEREKRWVIENKIRPPFEIGSMTTLGEITGLYSFGVARYEIKLHGQDDSKGFSRQIVKFEDAVRAS